MGVIPVGPGGGALNSSYSQRGSDAYKDELGNAVVNFARLVPDGLLVFFASYGAMEDAIGRWKENGGGYCGTGWVFGVLGFGLVCVCVVVVGVAWAGSGFRVQGVAAATRRGGRCGNGEARIMSCP